MAFKVGAITAELQLDASKFRAAIKKVKADQKSLSGSILRNSQQIKTFGRNLTIAGGVLTGFSLGTVKAFGNFDKAMTESLAIMGDVSDKMRKDMADAAREMSTQTTFSATELAGAYFFLASAGMDAAQSIKALPVVAKFAQAGTFDLATATDLLTDAQTALGLSSKDAIENQKNLIRVSDVLVGANTLANASVKQFAEALTNKAAAAMVNLNMEVEEGVAVLAAYADKGIKGQLAGQRLIMMLNGLFDATRRNKKAWDEAGISLFKADGSFRQVADIIQDLEGYLGAMTVKQREAALAQLGFNLRTKDSILTLMGSSEKIRQWNGDLKNMGSISEKVAKEQLQTLLNQFTLLKNRITNIAISIGKTLEPALEGLIEKLKGTIKEISTWIEEHPKLTGIIAEGTLALGALMLVLGPLSMMLPGLVQGFILLKLSFTSMLGPIGLVTTGLGFITIEVIKLTKNFKSLSATIDEYSNKSGEKISWLKKTWFSLNATIDKFTNGIGISEIASRKMREEITKLDKEHAKYGKKVWDSIKGTEGFSKASGILNKILGKQKEETKETSKSTSDLGETIEKIGRTIDKSVIPPIVALIMKLSNLNDELDEGILTWDEYLDQTIATEKRLKALKDGMGSLEMADEDMTQGFVESGATICGVLKGVGLENVALLKGINDGTIKTEKAIEKSWDELHPFMSNLCADLGGSFGNFAESILTTGSNMSDALQGLWGDIKSSFTRMIGDMVAKWMTDFVRNILKSVTNIGSEITKGIGGAATGASNIISTTASAASSLLCTLNVLFLVAIAVASIFNLFKKGADLTYTNRLLEDINWIQLNAVNKKLDVVNKNLSGIYGKLAGATGAQFGAVLTSPQMIMTHGTPAMPEYIIPSRAMESFNPESAGIQPLSKVGSFEGGLSKSSNFVINQNVTINAQTLDDSTIRQAGQKLFHEIKFQVRKTGGEI